MNEADATASDHLVEAATALANLMSSSPSSSGRKPCSASPRSVVSDNDDDDSTSRVLKLSPSADTSKREAFPHKLMAILNDSTLTDVVSWLPHGRSFAIIRPDVFTERVLPQYLPPLDSRSSTKYPSFTRKLNRWGFRQATRGPDTGAFHHPLFRRDKPELVEGMVCQRSRDRKPEAKKGGANRGPATPQAARKAPPPGSAEQGPATPLGVLDSPEGTMTPTSFSQANCAASVTDESRSEDSLSDGSPYASSCCGRIPKGITTDKAVVALSLQKRDEMERLRVAKAMLYESFIQALGDGNANL